jgi:hypothetical protein
MGDMLQEECKTRWTSTHAMRDSLMTMSGGIGGYRGMYQSHSSHDWPGQTVPGCVCQVCVS